MWKSKQIRRLIKKRYLLSITILFIVSCGIYFIQAGNAPRPQNAIAPTITTVITPKPKLKTVRKPKAASKKNTDNEKTLPVQAQIVSKEPEAKIIANRITNLINPITYISAGLGNIHESRSGTNNLSALIAGISHRNNYAINNYPGIYEVMAKYNYAQIARLVNTGGSTNVKITDEQKLSVDLLAILDHQRLFNIDIDQLCGIKLLSLNNPYAKFNMLGINIGIEKKVKINEKECSLRLLYTLPMFKSGEDYSIFGSPGQIVGYEISTDAQILSNPLKVSLDGEIMFFPSNTMRFYSILVLSHQL